MNLTRIALIGVTIGFAAVSVSRGPATTYAVANSISVDALPLGPKIESARVVRTGTEFEIGIYVENAGSPEDAYQGYEVTLCFDPDLVQFVPTEDLNQNGIDESWAYTSEVASPSDGTIVNVVTTSSCHGVALYGGQLKRFGTTNASGTGLRARFACIANGTSELHLVRPEDDAFATNLIVPAGGIVIVPTFDADIICDPDGPLPDSDGDGCTDDEEDASAVPPKPGASGAFDPYNANDFFDVLVPAITPLTPNGLLDKAINLKDVSAVLFYVGTAVGAGPNGHGVWYDTDINGDGVKDGRIYDRSSSPAPNPPWDAGPPDGSVTLQDVGLVLSQVGLDCVGPP